MRKIRRGQRGVTVVEVAMFLVVLAIIAVVAIPQFSVKSVSEVPVNDAQSSAKVQSAFALAIATKGDFPTLSEMVEFVDADFASEMSDLSGVMFRNKGKRLTVQTFNDAECRVLTSAEQLGVSDIVRCVRGS